MKTPDFTSKNNAVFTVLIMDAIFFIVAICCYTIPIMSPLSEKVWTLFMTANGAVLLALNIGTPNPAPGPKDTTTTTTVTKAVGEDGPATDKK